MKTIPLLAGALMLCAKLHGQAIPVLTELHGRDGELSIVNPTGSTFHVSISLFRDATLEGGPVVLGDSVPARISPQSFTLLPGATQTVRLRVSGPLKPGELLRLAILCDPVDSVASGVVARVALRYITKVRAEGGGP